MQVIKYVFQPHGDDRGQLIALEEFKDIPFKIKRVYYMYDTTEGVTRGKHAHKNLEQILIFDGEAKIINGGKYNGMDRYECRKAIVADLEEQGFLVKTEAYNHNVGCCYRCGTVVEPLTSPPISGLPMTAPRRAH